MLIRLFLTLTLVLLAGTPALAVQEEGPVLEHHPGGELLRSYETNAAGQKHGTFLEYAVDGTLLIKAHYLEDQLDGREQRFFASGKKLVTATWKRGELHGRYESFFENGKRELSANYKIGWLDGKYIEGSEDGKWSLTTSYEAGELDGAFKIKDHGKTLTQQKWKAGHLLELDGLQPFSRQRAALVEQLAGILADISDATETTDADALAERERAGALRRLQAYRALCGLAYEEMSLVPEWNALCYAAAEICRRLGRLSHTPERPDDTDDDLYRDGQRGASRSNLSMGTTLAGSVDGYMDDSDSSNIDRLGHRRWCLNPAMKKTGFGIAGKFSAMWSMDSSGGGARGLDAVFYPPPGYVPTQMFAPDHAWSISPLGASLPRKEKIQITIQRLGEHYLPVGDPLKIDYLRVATGGYGAGPCLIFRPLGLRVDGGKTYRCRVSFDGGKTAEYEYVVEFVSDARLARY